MYIHVHTLEPGTLAAIDMESSRAGPRAVCPDSNRLNIHQTVVRIVKHDSQLKHKIKTFLKVSEMKP